MPSTPALLPTPPLVTEYLAISIVNALHWSDSSATKHDSMAKPALAPATPAPGKPSPGAGGKANHGKDNKNGHSKKKKKRMRGPQKFRILHLQKPGEEPLDKRLKGGRVRKMNMLGNRAKDDALPRKTRDMLARIARMNGGDTINVNAVGQQQSNRRDEERRRKGEGPPPGRRPEDTRRTDAAAEKTTEKKGDHVDVAGVGSPVGPATSQTPSARFEGMKPDESFVQFNQRINQERRQAALDAARKLNHQRQKKKAHYEKRAQRELRRKRRRRGELSEDEDGEEDDVGNDDENNDGKNTGNNSSKRNRNYQANTVDDDDDIDNGLGALPTYWQDIVRNNGRPISEKKRKRMERLEKARDVRLGQRRQDGPWEQRQEKVRFGEQVDRPPTLTVMPRKRGGSAVKQDKNNRK